MTNNPVNLAGLSTAEAKHLQYIHGKNELQASNKDNFFKKVFHIICEPMFLLLIIAAVIYFILGEPRDGAIMLIFVIGIIGIDVIQEWKTDKALNALRDLSAPRATVVRDGKEQVIASSDLVPGDLMMIFEGVKIPADGTIVKCSDLRVDESTLTGESEGVWKEPSENAAQTGEYWRRDYCYAGTLVIQGTATVLVEKIGANTEYGKIGADVAKAPDERTPLQKQTSGLVRLSALIAAVLFVLVCVITFFNISDHKFTDRIIESILSGITLAMAMIPEEFPVILAVFLSMGAWRLAKKHALVRKLASVETLGCVSVLCVDKTGTITMNRMTVQDVWAPNGDTHTLIETMGLGCETDTYDPMEKAMLDYCDAQGIKREQLFSNELITEYAFTNELKMMGHVWKKDGAFVIAAKGSPEQILTLCTLSDNAREQIEQKTTSMSQEGLRVIAVASMAPETDCDIPETLTGCKLTFLGLIGLADPPRESIKKDIETCNKAGIRVVMITGDNGVTASAIAKKIGMKDYGNIITGNVLSGMTDEELREKVKTANIFSRVIPEHKMRIVKAFKDNGHVVAMTGDGVNDAPALKYADIGIAMGKRGSEVSREAADLILMDDNFTTITQTIRDGRRIYDNIRKAVGYVFTIHIPIAFSSLLAPFLGISPAALLLLPLHVVLLELIIDPTCSVVLERQPAEADIMDRPPRKPNDKLLNATMLTKSILQGVVIFLAAFGTYFYMLSAGRDAAVARTMGLAIIIAANLFLVFVNSSQSEFFCKSVLRLIKDKVMWGVVLFTVALLGVIIYTPLSSFLKLHTLSGGQLLASLGIAAVSVLWYEIVKLYKNHRKS